VLQNNKQKWRTVTHEMVIELLINERSTL